MKLKKLAAALMCVLALSCTLTNLTACSTEVKAADLTRGISPANVSGKAADEHFALSQTDFSLRLFRQSAQNGGYDNLLVSPLSVALALSMTANGANTDTLTEMEETLGMPIQELNEYLFTYVKNLPSDKDYTLHIANSLWLKDDGKVQVEQDFLQTNADYYGANLYKSAFDNQTLTDINNWVKNNTDGMIDRILNDISDDAFMYIVNALAFDARWMDVYEKQQVWDGIFTAENGTERTVDMMSSAVHEYLEDGNATGFIKNYEDRKYAFVALLPNEGMSLSDYLDTLTPEGLQALLKEPEIVETVTRLPKFSYEYSIDLKDSLAQMGMPGAFDLNTADFSRLGHDEDPGTNIYIGRVLHKTFIAVDELGTKAGAATVVEMLNGSAAPAESEIKYVTLDRPFFYMIIDRENNIPIFMGTVTDIN